MNRQKLKNCAAKVLLYLRKSHEMSQEKMALIISHSRSHYSRLESGQKSLLHSDVLALVDYFQIDVRSFQNGLLDMKSRNDADIFKIPNWFSRNAYFDGYFANALLTYFKKVAGELKVQNFLKDEQVDSTYFINYNNVINLHFVLRVIQEMKRTELLKDQNQVRKFAEYVATYLIDRQKINKLLVRNRQVSVPGLMKVLDYFKQDNAFVVNNSNPDQIKFSMVPRGHVDLLLFNRDLFLEGTFFSFFSELLVCLSDDLISCQWSRSSDGQGAQYVVQGCQ